MRVIPDDTWAALNIWMEARGEKIEGKIAVAEVMLNRLKKGFWGDTIAEVVLAPYQFSGWNTKDPNRVKAAQLDDQDQAYQECVKAWELAKAGSNIAKGATHYFNPAIVARPSWAPPSKMLARIGNHEFYKA
jgi:spore germination cell wall hydrolase CwlJ-like protein